MLGDAYTYADYGTDDYGNQTAREEELEIEVAHWEDTFNDLTIWAAGLTGPITPDELTAKIEQIRDNNI